jgi:hypothetical protein
VDAATIPGAGDNANVDHDVCMVEQAAGGGNLRVDVPIVSTFGSFQRGTHFECGHVLVFAITEAQTAAGAVLTPSYSCEYLLATVSTNDLKRILGADIVLLGSQLTPEEQQFIDDGKLDVWVSQGDAALSPEDQLQIQTFEKMQATIYNRYFQDPSRFLLQTLFPYPTFYMTVGLDLPEITDLDNVVPVLVDQAAQQAAAGLPSQ